MNGRVVRDCVLAVAGLVSLVALALWCAWVTEFAPNVRTLRQILAVIVLAGFGCLLSLFTLLVGILRADHYAGRERSRLMLPSILSAAWLTVYFGIASISAVDVLWHYERPWPLLRDPGVMLITAALVFGIVWAKAWMFVVILNGRSAPPRRE